MSTNFNGRQQCLLDAAKAVCGDRDEEYGGPEDNFGRISRFWSVYLEERLSEKLTTRDVAAMMVLLKVARIMGGSNGDSWVDIAGYAACGAEISIDNPG